MSVIEQRLKAAADKALLKVYETDMRTLRRMHDAGSCKIKRDIVKVVSFILSGSMGYTSPAGAACGRVFGQHHTTVLTSLRRSAAEPLNLALFLEVQKNMSLVTDRTFVPVDVGLLAVSADQARAFGYVGADEGAPEFLLRKQLGLLG